MKGFAIEELDTANNFRRLYTLGFSDDVESKVGVLAYMLAAQDITLQTMSVNEIDGNPKNLKNPDDS